MTEDQLVHKLSELLEDLGFDYDRFSNAGKETYEEIMSIIVKLKQ